MLFFNNGSHICILHWALQMTYQYQWFGADLTIQAPESSED